MVQLADVVVAAFAGPMQEEYERNFLPGWEILGNVDAIVEQKIAVPIGLGLKRVRCLLGDKRTDGKKRQKQGEGVFHDGQHPGMGEGIQGETISIG